MEADSGTGIGAYRFMLQQNLGKTMLEFQEVRMLNICFVNMLAFLIFYSYSMEHVYNFIIII